HLRARGHVGGAEGHRDRVRPEARGEVQLLGPRPDSRTRLRLPRLQSRRGRQQPRLRHSAEGREADRRDEPAVRRRIDLHGYWNDGRPPPAATREPDRRVPPRGGARDKGPGCRTLAVRTANRGRGATDRLPREVDEGGRSGPRDESAEGGRGGRPP